MKITEVTKARNEVARCEQNLELATKRERAAEEAQTEADDIAVSTQAVYMAGLTDSGGELTDAVRALRDAVSAATSNLATASDVLSACRAGTAKCEAKVKQARIDLADEYARLAKVVCPALKAQALAAGVEFARLQSRWIAIAAEATAELETAHGHPVGEPFPYSSHGAQTHDGAIVQALGDAGLQRDLGLLSHPRASIELLLKAASELP